MSVTAAEPQQLAAIMPAILAGDDSIGLAADKPAVGSGIESDGTSKSKTDSLGRSSIVGGLLGKLERLTILIGSDQDAVSKLVMSGAPASDAGGAARPSVLPVAGLTGQELPSSAEPSQAASAEVSAQSSAQLHSAAAAAETEVAATAAMAGAADAAAAAVQQHQQQQPEPPALPSCLSSSQLQPEHVIAEVQVIAASNSKQAASIGRSNAADAPDGAAGGNKEREPADGGGSSSGGGRGGGGEEGAHANLQLFESVLQEVALLAVRESAGDTAEQVPPQPFDQPLADILLEEELLWITGGLAAAAAAAAAEAPPRTYALGEVASDGECAICLAPANAAAAAAAPVRRRLCCRLPVCKSCLGMYFATCIAEGSVSAAVIRCPAAACRSHVAKDEVADCLSPELRSRYYRIIQNANCSPLAKTCPHCCHLYEVGTLAAAVQQRSGLKVVCSACSFTWCFPCHAPWHDGITCSQFREGDKALKLWAKEKHFGQLNARKCPKCKILIQRVAGCDHIHCKKCETDFCYRCGKRHLRVRFIGDHYDPLSILGCPYAFMQGRQRHLRRFVRGSIFTGQVLAVPVGVALAVGLLPVALAAVAIAGPVFGFIRLHRHLQQRKQASRLLHMRGKIQAT